MFSSFLEFEGVWAEICSSVLCRSESPFLAPLQRPFNLVLQPLDSTHCTQATPSTLGHAPAHPSPAPNPTSTGNV